jgi:hypothetical protein
MEIMMDWSRISNWEEKCGERGHMNAVGEGRRITKTKIKRERMTLIWTLPYV